MSESSQSESMPFDHKFDEVTRFCIYCRVSLADYFFHQTPCTRLMQPVPQRPEPIEEYHA